MNSTRLIKTACSVTLAVIFVAIIPSTYCQQKEWSTLIDVKNGQGLKSTSAYREQDTANTGSQKPKSVGAGGGSNIQMNRIAVQGAPPPAGVSWGKKGISDSARFSVGSHGSVGPRVRDQRIGAISRLDTLNGFEDTDMDGFPDAWDSNVPSAIKLHDKTEGFRGLKISSANERVCLIRYCEVLPNTLYSISLISSGSQAQLVLEEFSANNIRLDEPARAESLSPGENRHLTMQFLTTKETHRLIFRLEVPALGQLVVHELVIRGASPSTGN